MLKWFGDSGGASKKSFIGPVGGDDICYGFWSCIGFWKLLVEVIIGLLCFSVLFVAVVVVTKWLKHLLKLKKQTK